VSTRGRVDGEGLIKGHDFVHFYVLGQIALERDPSGLYDHAHQKARTQALAGPEISYLPVYGPQVALLFAPFGWLSYDYAWVLWTLSSAALYLLSCYLLWRSEPVLRAHWWPVLVGAVAFPPFCFLIRFGHISALALVAFTAAYLALRAERRWLAGLALGCVFLKPPLGLILPFVFVFGREWRVAAGAVTAVLLQLVVAWAYWGHDVLVEYFHVVTQLGSVASDLEPQPHQMLSLRSLFLVLLPWPAVAATAYGIAAVLVVAVVVKGWCSAAPLRLRYSLVLLGAILVDPHVNVYDLVIIAPVFILGAAWALDRRHVGWGLAVIAYVAYYVPVFVHVVSTRTRVQIGVIALVAMMWGLARSASRVHPSDR
jgi:hypothetical protein